jgi:hypothetical protein
MTAIRAKEENRTILDFSDIKCTRNGISKAINRCSISNIIEGETLQEFTYFVNEIKVGMYRIRLQLPFDCPEHCSKLKEYGDFEVSISDAYRGNIDLKEDSRFRNQDWVAYNFFGKLRIKHLVDIIIYCKRLDGLKCFL